jgi:multicomponent Na+:H+ antiporter subunit B
MENNSEIVSTMTGFLYPFIIIFGFYIILNGHLAPGGGFQGGAILAAVFISRYLVVSEADIEIKPLQTVEKILFLCILCAVALFVFSQWETMNRLPDYVYLILMNAMIGVKVCCGLTIIFFRFVFYESR